MNLYNAFATDQSAEINGVVLDYGPNSKNEPIQIRVARAGGANAKFAKVLEHKLRPYKRALANDTMDSKMAERLMIEAFAEAVVISWNGVEDREGNEIEFTKENIVKLFTDLPDLFRDVQEQSQKAALFRAELREAEQGNSQRS